MERTLMLIKPDAVQRGLVGEILDRYLKKGLKPLALKMLIPSKKQAEEHYAEHKNKSFFPALVEYITSGPLIAAVFAGNEAIAVARRLNGATDPKEAAPGTLRGDYGLSLTMNLVHAADSVASALRETEIYFAPEEIIDYEYLPEKWLY